MSVFGPKEKRADAEKRREEQTLADVVPTTLRKELDKQRFFVFNEGAEFDDMIIRPYCLPYKSRFIRVDPRPRDKFVPLVDGTPRTYKVMVRDIPGERVDEYAVLRDATQLPDGLYIYIVKRAGAVTVFSRIDSSVEVGSRHSIMPDSLDDEIFAAGEVKFNSSPPPPVYQHAILNRHKFGENVVVNTASYTFSKEVGKLHHKLNRDVHGRLGNGRVYGLDKLTEAHFTRICPGLTVSMYPDFFFTARIPEQQSVPLSATKCEDTHIFKDAATCDASLATEHPPETSACEQVRKGPKWDLMDI